MCEKMAEDDIFLTLGKAPKALINYLIIWQIGNEFSRHTRKRKTAAGEQNSVAVYERMGRSKKTLSDFNRDRVVKFKKQEKDKFIKNFGLEERHLAVDETAELIVEDPEIVKWWDEYIKFLEKHKERRELYEGSNEKEYVFPLNAFTDENNKEEYFQILRDYIKGIYRKYINGNLEDNSTFYKICVWFDAGAPVTSTDVVDDVIKKLKNVSFDQLTSDEHFDEHFAVIKDKYLEMKAIKDYRAYKNRPKT